MLLEVFPSRSTAEYWVHTQLAEMQHKAWYQFSLEIRCTNYIIVYLIYFKVRYLQFICWFSSKWQIRNVIKIWAITITATHKLWVVCYSWIFLLSANDSKIQSVSTSETITTTYRGWHVTNTRIRVSSMTLVSFQSLVIKSLPVFHSDTIVINYWYYSLDLRCDYGRLSDEILQHRSATSNYPLKLHLAHSSSSESWF